MLRIAHGGYRAGSFCWKRVQGDRLSKGNKEGSEVELAGSAVAPISHPCPAGDTFRF